jgi:uncharacterized protein
MDIDPVICPGKLIHIYPDEITGKSQGFPMTQAAPKSVTAFIGQQRLASGPLAEVALAVMKASRSASQRSILIFNDADGRPIDLDLRGSEHDVVARLPQPASNPQISAENPPKPRGRGRPRLGVVAREVTLLPRHWEWLGEQPGGASVALRKLVEAARRASGDLDRSRAARDAAYHFMSAMAGNLPGFEEASRTLFADDRRRFVALIAAWPGDIRDHIVKLAFDDRAEG